LGEGKIVAEVYANILSDKEPDDNLITSSRLIVDEKDPHSSSGK
jgi:hypothetical protein